MGMVMLASHDLAGKHIVIKGNGFKLSKRCSPRRRII